MNPVLADLIQVLQLEQLEINLFRGVSRDLGFPQVFGGQVLGQALAAASATIESDRNVHSLHAYFLLPGDVKAPIIYEVDRSRDGGSFSSRRVVAIQHGQPIFHMSASFQVAQQGLDHQSAMPSVPKPEELPDLHQLVSKSTDIPPELKSIPFPSAHLRLASIDHAMWLHRPMRVDDWLLYCIDSPSASGARGLSRGAIYDRAGTLVASVAQEGLIRYTH